jgi:hypothetical protein
MADPCRTAVRLTLYGTFQFLEGAARKSEGRGQPLPDGARTATHTGWEGHSLYRCLVGKSKLVMIPKRYGELLA